MCCRKGKRRRELKACALWRRMHAMRSLLLTSLCLIPFLHAEPIPVSITPEGLMRGGKPYFIKGVGGEGELPLLQRLGGNSVRTWSDDGLAELLGQAEKHQLTVCAGIWLESECSWFSYRNPEHCARQLARVKSIIEKHRQHPALLFWNIGNESEGDGGDPAYWKQLNALCEMAQQVDPHHPTITAVAGLSEVKAKQIVAHATALDAIGINTYAALPGLRESLEKWQWKKPWVVTEFGPAGHWERPKTKWERPIEQTSSEKAKTMQRGYERAIKPGGLCLGSYAFLWGQKQEATSTWFGLRTEAGDTTEIVDRLQEFWTGKKPENVAPQIVRLDSNAMHQVLKPGQQFRASVQATDADGDALTYEWRVDSDDIKRNAENREIKPATISNAIQSPMSAQITAIAPSAPGAYRLFVFVKDGKGHAGTANAAFRVDP